MRKVLGKMKSTLSILLAAAMIVTGLPQIGAIAYAAETQDVLEDMAETSGENQAPGENGAGEAAAPGESGQGQTPDEGGTEDTDEPGEGGTGDTAEPGEGGTGDTDKPDEGNAEDTDEPGEEGSEGMDTSGGNGQDTPDGQNPDETDPDDLADETEGEEEAAEDDGKAEGEKTPVKRKLAAYASDADTDIEAGGTNDAGTLTWTLYTNGKLVVEGKGDFVTCTYGENYSAPPWYSYSSEIESAEVRVTEATFAVSMFENCYNLREVDLSGFDTSKVVNMREMFRGCRSLVSLDLSGLQTDEVTDMCSMFNGCAGLSELNLSGLQTGKVSDMSEMFNSCQSLTSLDLSSFDTSSVKDMSYMFVGCDQLTSLDLSGFNVSSVENMNYMFGGCHRLTELHIDNFQTANVKHMAYMFTECQALTALDVSAFDTSEVIDMTCMFFGCKGLTMLDLRNFDITNVTGMSKMFRDCSSLISVDLSSFDMVGKTVDELFNGCSSLTVVQNPIHVETGISLPVIEGHAWRKPDGTAVENLQWRLEESITLRVDAMAGLAFTGTSGGFYTLQDATGAEIDLLTRTGTDGEKIVEIGAKEDFTFVVEPAEGYTLKSVAPARGADSTVALAKGSLQNQYIISPADAEKGYVRDEEIQIEILPVADTALQVSYDRSVADAVVANGTARTGDKPETVQVSNDYSTSLYVKIKESGNADQQEAVAWKLFPDGTREEIAPLQDTNAMSDEEKELEAQGWAIYRLGRLYEDMSVNIMARYSSAADDITGGTDGDIWWSIDKNGRLKVKGAGSFSTYSMPWLDYSYRDEIKSAVVDWETADASAMFQGCSNLEEVDIEYLKAENMDSMFSGCSKLATVDLSGMDTGSTTNMGQMFFDCESLTALDLSSFDTGSVTDMNSMFQRCRNLKSLDLGSFDTSSVTNMNYMFAECANLTAMDFLRSFDITNVTSMNGMFNDCSGLASVDLSSFDMEGKTVDELYELFSGCSSLAVVQNPIHVSTDIPLPVIEGHAWRKPDGTAVENLQWGLEESITLRVDAMAGIAFTGTSGGFYTLQDASGAEIDLLTRTGTDGEKIVEIGAKEDFNFVVEPAEGYTLKSVAPARGADSTVALAKGSLQNQYVISPADTEKGYVRDEEIQIEILPVADMALQVSYDRSVADAVVANGTARTGDKPETVQVSNDYSTSLYVKIKESGYADQQEAVAWKLLPDGTREEITPLQDTNAMSDEEKELEAQGWAIYRLGRLYEDMSVSIMARYPSAVDDIAGGTDGDIWWVIDKNGRLKVKGAGIFSTYYMPWLDYSYRDEIKSAVVDWETADASAMFQGCSNLEEADIEYLKAENMNSMFSGCTKLVTVDFGGMDTSSVTDMSYMFAECTNLTTLDLSSFDAGNGAGCAGMLDGCTSLREIKTPYNVQNYIQLPQTEGNKWRRADKSDIAVYTELPFRIGESITLTTDLVSLRFTGSGFVLKDSEGKVIPDNEILVDKGAKDELTYIVEAETGYMIKGAQTAGWDTTIILVRDPQATAYQYTVSPMDGENGYGRDEEIWVNTVAIADYTMRIRYPSAGVVDVIAANGDSQVKDKPASVQVSNAYDTSLYVKAGQTGTSGIQIPVVTVSSYDLDGNYYSDKQIPFISDTDAMSDAEKALAQDGYCIFNIGTLYGDSYVQVQLKTLYQTQFVTAGFPGDVRVIRYVQDEQGIWRGESCPEQISLESGSNLYFQVEWDQKDGLDYRWCRPEVNLSPSGAIRRGELEGVEGEVWIVSVDQDMTVQIALAPHKIGLAYVDGDLLDLKVEGINARLSDDKQTVEVYGGDSLSLSFELAENIELEAVSDNHGAPMAFEKGADGRYAVTMADLAKIHNITGITFATKDALDRYLLSDPELYVDIQLAQSSFYYTGQAVEPKVRRVTLSGGNLKKAVLKENKDYTVSYSDNIQVGTATLTITAAADSQRYRGSYSCEFDILKVPFTGEDTGLVQVDAENAGVMQQVDLSELFVINTKYEKGIKPLKYELYTDDSDYSLGGVLRENPVIQGSVMTYRTWPDADKYSEPAVIALRAAFDNYEDTTLYVRVQVVKKAKMTLGGTVTVPDKIYDGESVNPDISGLQVTAVEGQKPADAESALAQIRKDLVYRYTGTGSTFYDSDMAPIDAGTYRIAVAVSEQNEDFKSEYYDGMEFTISRRPIEFVADDVTLYVNDTAADLYSYQILGDGLAMADSVGQEPVLACAGLDLTKAGEYPVTVDTACVRINSDDGRDVTGNYSISGRNGILYVEMPKAGSYTVIYSLSGHGDDIIRSGMEAGSLLARPADPTAEGYVFLGWYSDEALGKVWNFEVDTIQADMTLYAGWTEIVTADKGMSLYVQEITPQIYTGKAVKPMVTVYAQDGKTLLKAGRDYAVTKYVNNVEADTGIRKFADGVIPKGGRGVQLKDTDTKENYIDTSEGFNDKLAYVIITGKGDYKGTVCMNFHINPVSISAGGDNAADEPAAGFKLKYTDQFAAKENRKAKIVSSLKYKKTLAYGTDYSLTVKKTENGNADVQDVALSSKGEIWLEAGEYELTIAGKGNYKGSIVKDIHIADNSLLFKNAKITYAKTIRNISQDELEEGVTQKDVRVQVGGIQLEDKDYRISYRNNHAVGTATMIVAASDESSYVGSKCVTFKIQGTGFKEKLFETIHLQDQTYTSTAITQNDVALTLKEGGRTLTYGVDYTISYKNNIKAGKATMTFTARPESGYSGSFKKSFKILPIDLKSEELMVDGARQIMAEEDTAWELAESVPYRKDGAKPSDQFVMRLGSYILTEGRDYKASYKDNTVLSEEADKRACMTVTGRGNYKGSVAIYYDITNASLYQMYQAGAVTISARAVPFDSSKSPGEDDYEDYEEYGYKPAITVKDGKQTLKEGEDYEVLYSGNLQSELEEYGSAAPYAEITGIGAYCGEEGEEAVTIPLSVYQRSISAKTIYVVYDDDDPYIYTGQQIRPNVNVYYGNAADVTKARRNKVTDEEELTQPKYDDEVDPEPFYAYGLTKLTVWDGESGNCTISYGTNIKQGKGTIIIRGVGGYSGSATVKFPIDKKDIYMLAQDPDPDFESEP